MQVIITEPDQLRSLVQEAVCDVVREVLPRLVREATRKEYLTPEEVKELTGWSDRTLQHLRDTRQLPFVQHGRKILYPTEEVEAFMGRHLVRARP